MTDISMYEKMKARGVNMSWYERAKGRSDHKSAAIPLDGEVCSNLSIYLLKENGSLWTLSHDGKPHAQVRPESKSLTRDVYICVHCKKQWNEMPMKNKSITHPDI